MKRIVLLICGLLLLVANTAEARRSRKSGQNYSQPTYAAPATYNTRPIEPVQVAPVTYISTVAKPVITTSATLTTTAAKTVVTTPTSYSSPAPQNLRVVNNSLSTATAQGVANIMASRGQVGHFGGNPGYEGCGMAASPQAAYSICCYANSGMATVDVGYAQGANGMWYCCRRYR